MRKKYLTARMSMFDQPDKVWKFKNPWNKLSYRIREVVFMNRFSLNIICFFISLLSINDSYWQMRLLCRSLRK